MWQMVSVWLRIWFAGHAIAPVRYTSKAPYIHDSARVLRWWFGSQWPLEHHTVRFVFFPIRILSLDSDFQFLLLLVLSSTTIFFCFVGSEFERHLNVSRPQLMKRLEKTIFYKKWFLFNIPFSNFINSTQCLFVVCWQMCWGVISLKSFWIYLWWKCIRVIDMCE